MKKKPEWCIVRWHNGELLVFLEYQWEPQGKNYSHKWEYVAKGIPTNEQAIEWARKYEKLLKEQ